MTYELRPKIVVFGVGGAGGNAVDNMIEANLQGVEFVVANTDAQALSRSKTTNRIQLGPETTKGLGAGARPDIGAEAAEESLEDINACLEDVNMVFIAAGMGGGTGTGAAAVIARAAQDKGILTVAVVTKPFGFEGTRRMVIAEGGLDTIRRHVDTMIVVPNQNLFRIANDRTTFAEAFRMADDVLYSGVRGITDLMVMPGLINLDFADVRAIMAGMGTAMMGMGEAEGEGRALEAARTAIDNPLLDDVTMKGAKGVLINITGGYDMTLFELDEAANEIRREIDPDATIIVGSAFDTELEGKIRVSVVAAGVEVCTTEQTRPQTAPTGEAQPVVITGALSPLRSDETDERPDFTGQTLPAEHSESMSGDAQVRIETIFSTPPENQADQAGPDTGAAPTGTQSLQGNAGFSNLFGWRRENEAGDNDEGPATKVPGPIVSSQDDQPDAADFDDEDLEIPAFLRRSANH